MDSIIKSSPKGKLAQIQNPWQIGIATGASIAAASAVVGYDIAIAVGPIIAVIAVGALTSVALGEIDNFYGITDRVISGIDTFGQGIQSQNQRIKNNIINETKRNETKRMKLLLQSLITSSFLQRLLLFIPRSIDYTENESVCNELAKEKQRK